MSLFHISLCTWKELIEDGSDAEKVVGMFCLMQC